MQRINTVHKRFVIPTVVDDYRTRRADGPVVPSEHRRCNDPVSNLSLRAHLRQKLGDSEYISNLPEMISLAEAYLKRAFVALGITLSASTLLNLSGVVTSDSIRVP